MPAINIRGPRCRIGLLALGSIVNSLTHSAVAVASSLRNYLKNGWRGQLARPGRQLADRNGCQCRNEILVRVARRHRLFCAGPTSALTWALYDDVADYGEHKHGRRSTGLSYSATLFSIKSGCQRLVHAGSTVEPSFASPN
jgi:hypothetical protein